MLTDVLYRDGKNRCQSKPYRFLVVGKNTAVMKLEWKMLRLETLSNQHLIHEGPSFHTRLPGIRHPWGHADLQSPFGGANGLPVGFVPWRFASVELQELSCRAKSSQYHFCFQGGEDASHCKRPVVPKCIS